MKQVSRATIILLVTFSLVCMVCCFLLFQNREYRLENDELVTENDSLLQENARLWRLKSDTLHPPLVSSMDKSPAARRGAGHDRPDFRRQVAQ